MSAAALALSATAALAATPASFPGGDEACKAFLVNEIHYPPYASENGIEGTVTVSFTVAADGSIGDVKVVRPLDPDLEAEAIRVVKAMPAWIPATDDAGTPVAQSATLPIKFTITE